MTPLSSKDQSPRSKEALLPRRNGEPIQCQFCIGYEFRRSRLRTDDIWQLLLFRYPARCLRCGQRQLVSFTVAALSVSSTARQPRPNRAADQGKNWTEPAERMVLRDSQKKESTGP